MKMMFQIGILFLVCLAGHAVSALLPFPVPGTVIAMIFLFLLLLFPLPQQRHETQLLIPSLIP